MGTVGLHLPLDFSLSLSADPSTLVGESKPGFEGSGLASVLTMVEPVVMLTRVWHLFRMGIRNWLWRWTGSGVRSFLASKSNSCLEHLFLNQFFIWLWTGWSKTWNRTWSKKHNFRPKIQRFFDCFNHFMLMISKYLNKLATSNLYKQILNAKIVENNW